MSASLRDRARRQAPRLEARLRSRAVPIVLGQDVPRAIEFRPEPAFPPFTRANWRPLPRSEESHALGTLGLLAVSAFLAFGVPAIAIYRDAIEPAWFSVGPETRAARAGVGVQGGDAVEQLATESGLNGREERLTPSDAASGDGETARRETEGSRLPASTSKQGSEQSARVTEDRGPAVLAVSSAVSVPQPSPKTTNRRDFSVPDLLPPVRESARPERGVPPQRVAISAEPKPPLQDVAQTPLAVRVPQKATEPSSATSNASSGSAVAAPRLSATNLAAVDPGTPNWLRTVPRGRVPAPVPGGVLLQSSWLKICRDIPSRRGTATDASVPCHVTSYLIDDPAPALFAVSLTTRPAAASTRLMLEFAQRTTDIEVWAGGDRVPLKFDIVQCSRNSCAVAAQLDPARGELIARTPALRLVFRTAERGVQAVTLSTDGLADAFDGPAASDIDARERRSELTAAWARAALASRRKSAASTRDPLGAPALVTGRI